MMKFRTLYTSRLSVISNPGSPIKEERQLRIVDNNYECVVTGKSSLYDYIQSHADSVDIHKILERCSLIEDYSLLNRMPAQFMDVTEMPDNLAEAYAQVQDAKNFFERMPVDIQNKYDNNFIQFINDIGSDRFMHNVSDFLDSMKKSNVSVEKEKTNES